MTEDEQNFVDAAIIELATTHPQRGMADDQRWCEIIAEQCANLAHALLEERRKRQR
jgi:hypothetical protein